MKVPLSWLREYVNLSLPAAALAERLTLAGLEVAGVQVLGLSPPDGLHIKAEEAGPVWDKDKVLIGEILEVKRHPDADRLTLPVVAYGEGRTKTLVTGAPNIKVGDKGQKVVVALCGSVLFDGHVEQKVLKELKPTKIRGVPSDAMVCSFKELGISDEHEGIIILEDDAPVGMPLADFMGDVVLELEVTPNLARCLSMIGVAREVSAITGQPLKLPDTRSLQQGEVITGQVSVLIEDSKLSARYAAALIKGIKVGPAPGWMQRRLTYAGMRPINNIVDFTNYVMLEWGQPLHAFDFDLLVQRAEGRAPVITVRPARTGEILVTLDGQKRELSRDNLVIADVRGPIALAGVMGGADTEVSDKTRNILLESASFDFVSIRRTMKQFNLPSEASVRFSKGIHPETVLPAATRAANLMAQHAGGTVCKGLVDTYPAPLPPQIVRLEMKEVSRALGMDFPAADALRILRALEYQVKDVGPGVLEAIVPPHRLDVQAGSADVIEDLVRIHGYDHLPATLLADRLPKQQTNQPLVFEEHLRDTLAGCGLQEVISYSLTTPEREEPFGQPGEYVRLLNPISSDRVVMRRLLLPGMLEVAAANLRHTDDVRLFEIGPVYLPRANEKLPDEPRRLALVLIGKRRKEFWSDAPGSTAETLDFFDMKGTVEALVTDLHLAQVRYEPDQAAFLHPGQAAKLVLADKRTAGVFGLMHPKTAAAIGLGERTVLAGEFDVDALQAAVPGRYTYDAVPRFPHALRDIAVIVDEGITAERLKAEILTAGGNLLREVLLFDLYKGSSIPPGTKSLAYALTYQAEDRTLTDKEVDKAHKKIEDRLKHVLHAQIRGKV